MLGPPKPRRLHEPIAISLDGLVPVDRVYRHPEAEVELRFQVAVEGAPRNERLQRDGDGQVEAAGLGRAEHGRLGGDAAISGDRSLTPAHRSPLFQQAAALWEPRAR